MKFEWTDTNGQILEIDNPEPIETRLQVLRDRYDAAQASGEHKLCAILYMHYDEQLAQWRNYMAGHFADLEQNLEKEIKNLFERAQWWQEWFSPDERPAQPTPLQLALLGEQPADISPKSWEQAATALNLIPQYRPPTRTLGWYPIDYAKDVEGLAFHLKESARKMSQKCQSGEVSEDDFVQHKALEYQFIHLSETFEKSIAE